MQNKLFKNLQLLTPLERKRFLRWLHSPWANTNKKLIQLFKLILPYYPDFPDSPSFQKQLYHSLHPKKPFHKKQMYNLMSDLSKQVEHFLVHEDLSPSSTEYIRSLIDIYDRKGQLDLWRHAQGRLLKQLNASKPSSAKYHLYLSEGFEFLIRNQKPDLKLKEKEVILEKASEHLDYYYLLRKLRHWVVASEDSLILTGKPRWEKKYYQALKLLIPEHNSTAVDWYEAYLEKNEKESIEKFRYLKQLFFDQLEELELEDQNIILRLLVNMATRLLLKGQSVVQEEMLELYQFGLRTKMLLYNNRLTPQIFINVIGLANNLGEISYARQLTKDYTRYLNLDIQEDARLWALTKIAYLSNSPDLKDLIGKLDHRNTTYTSFSLMIRLLIIQIRFDAYYSGEDDIDEAFWNYNEAFTRKLQREKKFSKKHIVALQRFNDFVKALAKNIRSSKDVEQIQAKLAKFEARIREEKILHAREWLLERVKRMSIEYAEKTK